MVGGRRYGLFGHDFRRVPVDALMELWTERALAQDVTCRPSRSTSRSVLSQADFTDAVRHGLRDLYRPDLLARNPLLRTRLAHDFADTKPPDAEVLARLLLAAVDALRRHPRDDKLLRAVERTYCAQRPPRRRPPSCSGCRSAPTGATSPKASHRVVACPVGPRALRHDAERG